MVRGYRRSFQDLFW